LPDVLVRRRRVAGHGLDAVGQDRSVADQLASGRAELGETEIVTTGYAVPLRLVVAGIGSIPREYGPAGIDAGWAVGVPGMGDAVLRVPGVRGHRGEADDGRQRDAGHDCAVHGLLLFTVSFRRFAFRTGSRTHCQQRVDGDHAVKLGSFRTP